MYVAIRDSIVSWLGYKELIAGIRDLGLESFELSIGRDLKSELGFDISTDKGRREVKKRLTAENVQICALLVSNDFSKEDISPEVKWVADACKAASDLGVDTVRIDAPHSRPGVTMEEHIKRTAQFIREVIERTRGLDVALGMENHGTIGNNREFIQAVLGAARSERVGLTLDTGNFYWYGYPLEEVYEIIKVFAPYTKHTHVKNLSFSQDRRQVKRTPGEGYPKTAAPIHKGDIDIQRVVKTLKKTGYDKDLAIEDESLGNFPQGQRADIVKNEVKYLKSLI